MEITVLHSNYFAGHRVSNYGQMNNRLDYATFSAAFSHVHNDNIFYNPAFEWKIISPKYIDDDLGSVMQWYIVERVGADFVKAIGDILVYDVDNDIYLWGVTHVGTPWESVLTPIKLWD